jgi:urease accessory protein UreF
MSKTTKTNDPIVSSVLTDPITIALAKVDAAIEAASNKTGQRLAQRDEESKLGKEIIRLRSELSDPESLRILGVLRAQKASLVEDGALDVELQTPMATLLKRARVGRMSNLVSAASRTGKKGNAAMTQLIALVEREIAAEQGEQGEQAE